MDLGTDECTIGRDRRLVQAARSCERGYRNDANGIAMSYLIGSPVGCVLD